MATLENSSFPKIPHAPPPPVSHSHLAPLQRGIQFILIPQVSRSPDISQAKYAPFSRLGVESILLEGLPSPKKLRSKKHASFPCLKGIMGGDPDLGEELDSSGSPLAPKSQSLRPLGTGKGER